MANSNLGNKSFSQRFTAAMGKFASARYVKVISAGMMGIMPISLAGSFFMIVTTLTFLPQSLRDFCQVGSTVTLNLIAVYTMISMAVAMAKECKQEIMPCVIATFAAFFTVTPMKKMFVEAVEGSKSATVINLSHLGSGGMFVGIICAILACRIYALFVDKKIYITMPPAVPKGVSKIFESIVPVAAIMIVFVTINAILSMTSYGNMHDLVYKILQMPLQNLGSNIVAACVLYAISEFLWFFGIHGSNVTKVFLTALFATQAYENASAVVAGQDPQNLINMFFLESFKGPRALSLAVLLLFMCKSQHMKSVGKVAIVPSLFGITEPMKFGVPMVMNVWILVPMTLGPVVSVLIAYAASLIGFLPIVSADISRQVPPVIQGFLVCGWQGAVIQVIQLIVLIAMYIPFVLKIDKDALEVERAKAVEA